MKSKKVLLKKDFVIPTGTVLNECGGLKVEFSSGNYESIIGTSKDSCASFYVNEDVIYDNPDTFECVS